MSVWFGEVRLCLVAVVIVSFRVDLRSEGAKAIKFAWDTSLTTQ